MRQYRSVARRPRAIEPGHVDPSYWTSTQPDITVFQNDGPHDTGLLDQRCNPIMSFETIGPIGFNRI